jgi:hypothetical protein
VADEAVARINTQLSQKKAPQHVDVRPIREVWPYTVCCPSKTAIFEQDPDTSFSDKLSQRILLHSLRAVVGLGLDLPGDADILEAARYDTYNRYSPR